MRKKLTITLDERIYEGLRAVVGRRRISRYIEELVCSHLSGKDLEAGYEQMAKDETHEAEALEWTEGTVGDIADFKATS